VIFSEQVNDPVWMAQKPFNYAARVKARAERAPGPALRPPVSALAGHLRDRPHGVRARSGVHQERRRLLVFFFSFEAAWTNFFLPYTVLADSSKDPIQVGLSQLLSSTRSLNPAAGGGGQQVNIFRPEPALAALLAVVPVAIVFMLSQRALVPGIVGGGVKE
jgi:hypothetical protein